VTKKEREPDNSAPCFNPNKRKFLQLGPYLHEHLSFLKTESFRERTWHFSFRLHKEASYESYDMFEGNGNKSNYPSIIDTTLLHFGCTDSKHPKHVPLSAKQKQDNEN
jgi:hypothetical protein